MLPLIVWLPLVAREEAMIEVDRAVTMLSEDLQNLQGNWMAQKRSDDMNYPDIAMYDWLFAKWLRRC